MSEDTRYDAVLGRYHLASGDAWFLWFASKIEAELYEESVRKQKLQDSLRFCALCGQQFRIFIKKRRICQPCGANVCNRCGIFISNNSGWICRNCQQNRLFQGSKWLPEINLNHRVSLRRGNGDGCSDQEADWCSKKEVKREDRCDSLPPIDITRDQKEPSSFTSPPHTIDARVALSEPPPPPTHPPADSEGSTAGTTSAHPEEQQPDGEVRSYLIGVLETLLCGSLHVRQTSSLRHADVGGGFIAAHRPPLVEAIQALSHSLQSSIDRRPPEGGVGSSSSTSPTSCLVLLKQRLQLAEQAAMRLSSDRQQNLAQSSCSEDNLPGVVQMKYLDHPKSSAQSSPALPSSVASSDGTWRRPTTSSPSCRVPAGADVPDDAADPVSALQSWRSCEEEPNSQTYADLLATAVLSRLAERSQSQMTSVSGTSTLDRADSMCDISGAVSDISGASCDNFGTLPTADIDAMDTESTNSFAFLDDRGSESSATNTGGAFRRLALESESDRRDMSPDSQQISLNPADSQVQRRRPPAAEEDADEFSNDNAIQITIEEEIHEQLLVIGEGELAAAAGDGTAGGLSVASPSASAASLASSIDELELPSLPLAFADLDFSQPGLPAAFPELGLDVIEPCTDDAGYGTDSWQENWLFCRRRHQHMFGRSDSAAETGLPAESVPMLVPDPTEPVPVTIGARDVDELSELSEAGSDVSLDETSGLLSGDISELLRVVSLADRARCMRSQPSSTVPTRQPSPVPAPADIPDVARASTRSPSSSDATAGAAPTADSCTGVQQPGSRAAIVASAGCTVQLLCSTIDDDADECFWFGDGELLRASDRCEMYRTAHQLHLVMYDVRPQQAGRYSCLVMRARREHWHHFNVKVRPVQRSVQRPSFSAAPEQQLHVAPDSPLRLTFRLSGYPEPRLSLCHDGRTLTRSDIIGIETHSCGEWVLTLGRVSPADSGHYTAVATSSSGRETHQFHLTVSEDHTTTDSPGHHQSSVWSGSAVIPRRPDCDGTSAPPICTSSSSILPAASHYTAPPDMRLEVRVVPGSDGQVSLPSTPEFSNSSAESSAMGDAVKGVDYSREIQDNDGIISSPLLIPGTVSEREHRKWQNPVCMPNNPYTTDMVERRRRGLSSPHSSVVRQRSREPAVFSSTRRINCGPKSIDHKYGRDYYVNGRSGSSCDLEDDQGSRPTSALSEEPLPAMSASPEPAKCPADPAAEDSWGEDEVLQEEDKPDTAILPRPSPDGQESCGSLPDDLPPSLPSVKQLRDRFQLQQLQQQPMSLPCTGQQPTSRTPSPAVPRTTTPHLVSSSTLIIERTESAWGTPKDLKKLERLRRQTSRHQVHSLTARSVSRRFREGLKLAGEPAASVARLGVLPSEPEDGFPEEDLTTASLVANRAAFWDQRVTADLQAQ